MKASHFIIGPEKTTQYNKSPSLPENPEVCAINFSVEEARKRLSQASWTTGQSPMKYESIQQTGFPLPPSNIAEHNLAKKQFNELKSRISASSVNKGQSLPNDQQ